MFLALPKRGVGYLSKSFVRSLRGFSSASGQDWVATWKKEVDNIKYDEHFEDSADQLRGIVKRAHLRFTDLRDNPERFFSAHRYLAERSPELGPGFWIRFTVQYNLFAGTILGCAGESQLSILDDMQEKGELGCFALTEKFAGVNSGLVVNTEIEWDQDRQVFVLNTPNDGAKKNWISQGFTADKAVVIANLKVGGGVVGPHAFVMDFRRDGKLVDNITIDDMGTKTVGNDLDNAWIHFDHVELPKSAMLNRFADIDDDGNYALQVPGIRPFDMIGQRLFSGRIAVAQAAMTFRKKLYEKTKDYTDDKLCWAPKKAQSDLPVLSSIPQLTELFNEEQERYEKMETFIGICEDELNGCLRANKIPTMDLMEAIAVSKVKAVEESIEMSFRLKQEVGSYALMAGSGFEQMDFLQCCKFAEGDSRILMLKMARDRLGKYQKKGPADGGPTDEDKQCQLILDCMVAAKDGSASEEAKVYNEMNCLAEMTMERILDAYMGK
jgi:acyl-CoA oxidase